MFQLAALQTDSISVAAVSSAPIGLNNLYVLFT
jgi:hypothetical protein